MTKKTLNLSAVITIVVVSATLLFSCNGKTQNENLAKGIVKKTDSISKTKIYKGRFTTIMDVICTQTLTLDLNEKRMVESLRVLQFILKA